MGILLGCGRNEESTPCKINWLYYQLISHKERPRYSKNHPKMIAFFQRCIPAAKAGIQEKRLKNRGFPLSRE
jgi:hypothetical protein